MEGDFLDRFLGCKRSAYTRVNTVFHRESNRIGHCLVKNSTTDVVPTVSRLILQVLLSEISKFLAQGNDFPAF